jgi:uncharacterized protein
MFGYTEADVASGKLSELESKISEKGRKSVCEELDIGEPTLKDIVSELLKPGRDVRDSLPPPVLRDDVMSMEDLKPDMILDGTVRNVCDFGAFVDIGVHQDGLVHISQISDKFIKHPSEALSVGDRVKVTVISLDIKAHRHEVWSCPIPGVEKGDAFGIRESKRYSIAR